jgi:hypothetical protein
MGNTGMMERWKGESKKLKVASVKLTHYSMLLKSHHSIGHPI